MPLVRTDQAVDMTLSKVELSKQKWRSETADAGLDELAASIKEQGQIHTVSLLRNGNGKYEVINGNRRVSAARLGKHGTIRADLYDWQPDGDEDRELAIARHLYAANLAEPLTLLEKARMFDDIQRETNFSIEQLAEMFEDETADSITDALRLLDISAEALEVIERNPDRFTEAHLRVLADYAGASKKSWKMKPEEQARVAREIVEQQDKVAVRDPRKFETRIKSVVKQRRDQEASKRKEAQEKERKQSDPVKEIFKLLEQAAGSVSDYVEYDVAQIKEIDPVDKGYMLNRTYQMIQQLTGLAEEKLVKLPQRKVGESA